MTDTITKAAQAFVAAIKIDRHDWEDWPSDSRKAFEALKAALAAPQPEPDMRAICEALGFDPTNHHNAAKCPYCRPPEPPKRGFPSFDEAVKQGRCEPQPVKQAEPPSGFSLVCNRCGKWAEYCACPPRTLEGAKP